jgi:hypothetical protein
MVAFRDFPGSAGDGGGGPRLPGRRRYAGKGFCDLPEQTGPGVGNLYRKGKMGVWQQ